MARKNTAISNRIQAMEVGTTEEFPLENLSRVRVAASLSGLSLARKYTTSSDPEHGVVRVTRQS